MKFILNLKTRLVGIVIICILIMSTGIELDLYEVIILFILQYI